MENTRAFMAFAAASPTAFQAVDCAAALLDAAGYTALNEYETWPVVPGGKYYVTRNGSTLIALRIPETGLGAFRVTAAHGDSPLLKLKPRCEEAVLGHYVRLNVERYGGAILSTWLDRPLSVAGRIVVRTADGLSSRSVDLGRDAILIPNMPIHFNRDVNDGYRWNPQVDLLPLYGDETAAGGLMRDIAEAAGVEPDAIVASDLYAYNRTPGTIWGKGDAFFSCPRIDDLECAWGGLQALMTAKPSQTIDICAIIDNEEVGSTTRQGAASLLLNDVMTRTALALGADEDRCRALLASALMVSADNAHAVHPNHPEKYDADNRTWMNGGVVVKTAANQKYATDAVSAAIFSEICAKAGVPVQRFANRSDIMGGSTLGNIANTQVSMCTVDIGLAQLAMHSCYETAGTRDLSHLIAALRCFYETDIRVTGDGQYRFA